MDSDDDYEFVISRKKKKGKAPKSRQDASSTPIMIGVIALLLIAVFLFGAASGAKVVKLRMQQEMIHGR